MPVNGWVYRFPVYSYPDSKPYPVSRAVPYHSSDFKHLRRLNNVQLHVATDDQAAIIETCVRLGDASEGGDTHLWTEALAYFGSQTTDCEQQVQSKGTKARCG